MATIQSIFLQEITKSIEHSSETPHGVTGLSSNPTRLKSERNQVTAGWSSAICPSKCPKPNSIEITMPKVVNKTLVAALVANCRLNRAEAKRVVETILQSMKTALAEGKKIDLGRLGVLSVATRAPMRRINSNLKHVTPTIENVYRRHPKTVRLTRGKDLSESPQPTIVHKKPQPAARKSFAVAFPSWRRRMR